MPTREELTQHLLLSYILTYNERILQEFVEDPAAVLDRLELPADSMRCPPEAHRALARAEGAVREAEALSELEAVRALPMVSEIVSRHLAGPVRLRKLPFGVQFEESQTPAGEEGEGRQDMAWTATGDRAMFVGFQVRERHRRVSPPVLIVGQLPDPHIDAVARELETLGATPILFNRLCPEESRVTYRLENDAADGEIATAHGAIRLSEIQAVWWRVKPFSLAEYGAEPMPVVEGFVDREWRSVLNSLTAFTPGAFWINPRAADLVAREKPVQLYMAREAGLAIPPTRISNDPSALADFAGEGERTIYKPVTWYADIPDRFIFTSQVDLDQIRQKAEEIQVAPGIFQRRIPKAYELRVTVVGDRCFSVRIDSQTTPGAELDWRRRQNRLHYVPCALSDDVCDRLLTLHRKLGLIYGAYDLIVTPEGEHVFLEVNPSGQWLWLELHTGLAISRELAGCLVRSCRGEVQVPPVRVNRGAGDEPRGRPTGPIAPPVSAACRADV